MAYGDPIKIQSFQSSSDVIAPNSTVTLSFLLSKQASVLLAGFDANGNLQAHFFNSSVSGSFDYSTGASGLYRWELTATR